MKDVTKKIKDFYENNPFPNYDDLDDASSLMQRARQGLFAKLLDEQIPFGARILEAGCGTGQLSNFLSIANRTVFGTDLCFASLKLAQQFKQKNKLNSAHFVQMNLFKPVFKPKSFDLVICQGVLHHTSFPAEGFRKISQLVKDNGYILIGLYHKYGRIITDIRRIIFKLLGNRFSLLDPELKNLRGRKRDIWFMDQYRNPHESKHSIREALRWFNQNGFKFINSVPKTHLWQAFSDKERLFSPNLPASGLELFCVELGMLFTASSNGGLFIVIGKKTNE